MKYEKIIATVTLAPKLRVWLWSSSYCERGLPNTSDLHGVSVPFCTQNFSTQQSLMADYHPPSLLLSFITGFIMKTLTQP